MKLERFADLVAAYGGQPQHWSITERDAALQLLKESSQAQQLQEEALQLDALLDCLPDVQPTENLTARILADLPIQRLDRELWQWLAQWLWGDGWSQHVWRPALTLLSPLALGVLVGALVVQQQPNHLLQTAELVAEQATKSEFENLLNPEQQTLSEWSEWL